MLVLGLTMGRRYTYSLVFAADMYATRFKADPLDPARGKLYREQILPPGGSQDDIKSLEVRTPHRRFQRRLDLPLFFMCQDFLGRPPNSEAFVKELFGENAQANL